MSDFEILNLDKKEPLVSIAMLAYNHEKYISQAIDSILMQETNFDYKIIIAEDYSTDRTRQIIRKYQEKYPNKFKLILQNSNAGVNQNNLDLLSNLEGKYIAALEGDDYWTGPLKLQKQVDFLEANPDYGMCFHKVRIYDQTNNKLITDNITREVEPTTNATELAKGNYIHTPSVMLCNDFIIPKWFNKSPIGDWPLYMLAIKGRKIKKMEETMAVYRLHNAGVWSLKSKKYRVKQTLKSFQLVFKYVDLDIEAKKTLSKKISYYKSNQGLFYSYVEKIKRKLRFNFHTL